MAEKLRIICLNGLAILQIIFLYPAATGVLFLSWHYIYYFSPNSVRFYIIVVLFILEAALYTPKITPVAHERLMRFSVLFFAVYLFTTALLFIATGQTIGWQTWFPKVFLLYPLILLSSILCIGLCVYKGYFKIVIGLSALLLINSWGLMLLIGIDPENKIHYLLYGYDNVSIVFVSFLCTAYGLYWLKTRYLFAFHLQMQKKIQLYHHTLTKKSFWQHLMRKIRGRV